MMLQHSVIRSWDIISGISTCSVLLSNASINNWIILSWSACTFAASIYKTNIFKINYTCIVHKLISVIILLIIIQIMFLTRSFTFWSDKCSLVNIPGPSNASCIKGRDQRKKECKKFDLPNEKPLDYSKYINRTVHPNRRRIYTCILKLKRLFYKLYYSIYSYKIQQSKLPLFFRTAQCAQYIYMQSKYCLTLTDNSFTPRLFFTMFENSADKSSASWRAGMLNIPLWQLAWFDRNNIAQQ